MKKTPNYNRDVCQVTYHESLTFTTYRDVNNNGVVDATDPQIQTETLETTPGPVTIKEYVEKDPARYAEYFLVDGYNNTVVSSIDPTKVKWEEIKDALMPGSSPWNVRYDGNLMRLYAVENKDATLQQYVDAWTAGAWIQRYQSDPSGNPFPGGVSVQTSDGATTVDPVDPDLFKVESDVYGNQAILYPINGVDTPVNVFQTQHKPELACIQPYVPPM